MKPTTSQSEPSEGKGEGEGMGEEKDFQQRLRTELVQRGCLSESEFDQCLEEARRSHRSLIEALYHAKKIAEKEVVLVLSQLFGYPCINVATFIIEPEVLQRISKEAAEKYHVLPVTEYEKTLTVAMADPTNLRALDDIRALSGLRIKAALAAPSQLEEAVRKYYGNGSKGTPSSPTESFEKIFEDVRSQLIGRSAHRESADTTDLLEEANATPIIRLVSHLLIEAIRRHASDLFVEPWERTMRVRFRIDGVLEEILNTPRQFVNAVISRIKVISRLNIAEHRIPQDGRFKARVFGRDVDVRVSILPTSYGEKACLRILDSGTQALSLDQLGFAGQELEIVHRTASKPHGMILVTGPTGSGKTTTLYAVLQYLDSPEKNITTVEDPVEYQLSGINQVNVRENVGLTFPIALRSILRQDPDILLIGEIRDLVTMDIAIKSALTGHLVLSTLHTNDATSAIVRMINMGVEPFLIASSVLMISAQRLVRKLCPLCRSPYTAERELLESLGIGGKEKLTFYRPKGCEQCRSTGFKGRTVITELFELKPPILDLIMKGGSAEAIRGRARECGMTTLRENGIEKVRQGITAVEEVLRVTSPDPLLQLEKV